LIQAAAWVLWVQVAEAPANVDLEWRVSAPIVRVGETFEVGLYAVSDDGGDQTVTAIQAILSWDPNVLVLAGKIDNGPNNWTISAFDDDSNLDGLNADCRSDADCGPDPDAYCGPDLFCEPDYTGLPYNDGDAWYQAFAHSLSPMPVATPEGMLVTTILFTAVAPTPATELVIPPTAGSGATSTRVIDAEAGETHIITGELRPLTLSIALCGTKGDSDGDCAVGLADYAQIAPCLAGPDELVTESQCQNADMDDDGDVDLRDMALVQLVFNENL
jgi:hypothetical protein